MPPDASFWSSKRVLVTGHTGFKGAWLCLWLHRLGAHITGVSLAPATQPNLFDLLALAKTTDSHIGDICDAAKTRTLVQAARPDVVFHLAAQAIVSTGYRQPLETFATNVLGTANVLDAIRGLDCTRVVVSVTTDKVYRNREWHYPYREDDPLGGHDPYSASKAAAEMVIASYRASFMEAQCVALASARAGNVVGGGDWSPDRLIPDAMRAWCAGRALDIRHPEAVRPWQHVLEPLAGYLTLAQRLWDKPELAGAYNFGPNPAGAATVRRVVDLARMAYGTGHVLWGDGDHGPHEAGLLTLETAKAHAILGVEPRWDLRQTIDRTVQWYLRLGRGESALALCLADIAEFGADQ